MQSMRLEGQRWRTASASPRRILLGAGSVEVAFLAMGIANCEFQSANCKLRIGGAFRCAARTLRRLGAGSTAHGLCLLLLCPDLNQLDEHFNGGGHLFEAGPF